MRYHVKKLLLKVVDSCWISSTEWSDTFRSFFVYGKKQESRKKIYHNRAKNFTFLSRFDRKNTVLGISRNLIDKLVFKMTLNARKSCADSFLKIKTNDNRARLLRNPQNSEKFDSETLKL